jgi:hypothetical protein
MNLLALGNKANRLVKDTNGDYRDLHALGSCEYLKIAPSNHIFFSCQFYNDR